MIENIQTIWTALETAEQKILADPANALQLVQALITATKRDPQGFLMHLDAIEHAFLAGYAAAGGQTTGQAAKRDFATYEATRRGELGL